jgi:type I restriction enzyme S subunit
MRYFATKFGAFLNQRKQFIQIEDIEQYRRARVQLHWKGIVLRDEVEGTLVKTKKQQVARQGELLVAEIDAKVGGVGIVPPELDRAIVSSHYFLFEINESKCLRRWLDWFVRSGGLEDQFVARGSTNYAAIRPHHILNCEIPLPPLDEQRRIVARVEELTAKVNEARSLRNASSSESQALIASETKASLDTAETHGWPVVSLGDVTEIQSGVTLGRQLRGSTIRLPYLRVANVQDGRLDLSVIKEVEILPSEIEKWQLMSGDVLLTEGGDWDKLGRGTVWRAEIPNCIHQNHIFRVRANPNEFDPDFIAAIIASPYGKAYFQAASKQTTNLASINQRQLKSFRLFHPPLEEQRRFVARSNAFRAKVKTLNRLQSETAAELDALMPSILSKAFHGEL